jgi:hypothetical protein
MTLVTTPGSEIMDRCGAFTSVMWACAFSAMASCSAGGMAWSAVPTTAQDGMVCQAGTPDGSVRAVRADNQCYMGRCTPPRPRFGAAFGVRRAGVDLAGGAMILGLWA